MKSQLLLAKTIQAIAKSVNCERFYQNIAYFCLQTRPTFQKKWENYRWPVTPRNPQTSRRAAAALFRALGRMSSARARCFSLAPSTFVSSVLNTLFTTSATRNGYYTLWGASFASFRFLPSNYLLISMPVKLHRHRMHFSVEYLNNNCPYTTTRGCWFCHRM